MKKSILFLIAAAAAVQSLSAQSYMPARDSWKFDIQMVQHAGLNKWNDTGYANAGFPRASMTEFRGVVNF
jgi:hypothetical protein